MTDCLKSQIYVQLCSTRTSQWGVRLDFPTLLRDLHWTPRQDGPGMSLSLSLSLVFSGGPRKSTPFGWGGKGPKAGKTVQRRALDRRFVSRRKQGAQDGSCEGSQSSGFHQQSQSSGRLIMDLRSAPSSHLLTGWDEPHHPGLYVVCSGHL